jgi:hypothetical protein
MVSLKMTCEVTKDGSLLLRLPQKVTPGLHEIVLVIDEKTQALKANQAEQLMQFAGVWRETGIDPTSYQRQLREEWT